MAILSIIFFSQCSSGKYYPDFKLSKKNVDSLLLIKPIAFVKRVKNNYNSFDTVVANKISNQVLQKTKSTLSKKYYFAEEKILTDSIFELKLFDLFKSLDTQGKTMTEVKTPLFIGDLIPKSKLKYSLLIFFQGFYNGNYEPYQNIQQSMNSNSIYINRQLFSSDLRTLIVDNSNQRIVFYNKKYSGINDPRIKEFVEQMTLDVIKPIYYK